MKWIRKKKLWVKEAKKNLIMDFVILRKKFTFKRKNYEWEKKLKELALSSECDSIKINGIMLLAWGWKNSAILFARF